MGEHVRAAAVRPVDNEVQASLPMQLESGDTAANHIAANEVVHQIPCPIETLAACEVQGLDGNIQSGVRQLVAGGLLAECGHQTAGVP